MKTEAKKAYDKVYRAANKAKIREYQLQWKRKNQKKLRAESVGYRSQLKLDVIEKYGGACSVCGLTELACLSIDHINGGGSALRRRLKYKNLYPTLRGLPRQLDLRCLCMNCQWRSKAYGSDESKWPKQPEADSRRETLIA